MTKGFAVYLLHIIEAIELIEKQIRGMTEQQFYDSEVIQGFVERKFMIIGEATKHIPEEFKTDHPKLPWKQMAAMRNILIHEYEDVDIAIVWDAATQYLVPLKSQLQELLKVDV